MKTSKYLQHSRIPEDSYWNRTKPKKIFKREQIETIIQDSNSEIKRLQELKENQIDFGIQNELGSKIKGIEFVVKQLEELLK